MLAFVISSEKTASASVSALYIFTLSAKTQDALQMNRLQHIRGHIVSADMVRLFFFLLISQPVILLPDETEPFTKELCLSYVTAFYNF